jgi:hypothetical protein
MRRRHVKPRVGNRISKPRLGPAKRLAAGGACVAFGIDAGILPHHENWRESPVMVSVRFTRLARSESATSVTAGLLDLDEVAACSHLTTPICRYLSDPDRKYRAVMTGRGRVSTPVEVNFDRAATTNHVAAARRRMIGMVRWHRAACRR